MKIRINENELKNITYKVVKRALNEMLIERKTIKKNAKDGYLKASRSGNREADKEINGDGFKQITKVHRSPKDYSRKGRNKDSWKKAIDENDEDEITYKTATVDDVLTNITVDFTESTYKDDKYTIIGTTDNGFKADIKFSNKKVRLAVANLLNKEGRDEYLKTYK